jgi:hypothetical protein
MIQDIVDSSDPATVPKALMDLLPQNPTTPPESARNAVSEYSEYSTNLPPWTKVKQRLVQHHGRRFNYDTNKAETNEDSTPLPRFLAHLTDSLMAVAWPSSQTQITLNLYPRGSVRASTIHPFPKNIHQIN